MGRLGYLAQIILGGVGLATLFKLIAVVGLLLMPNGPEGPMTRTFARTASAEALTRELKPFAEPFMARGSGDSGATLAELSDLRPSPGKVREVLVVAEACYPPRENQSEGLAARCSPERLMRVEALVRWWAVLILFATILLGGLGWWVNDQLRRLGEARGLPRSAAGLKQVFEDAVAGATLAPAAKDLEARRPRGMEDLISGDFRFSRPEKIADPAEPGVTFWLVAGLIIAASALIALSGGILVAAAIVLAILIALPLLRFGLARLGTDAAPYVLEYAPVERPDPAASPDVTTRSGTSAENVARDNLEIYEGFMKRAFEEVERAENPASRERNLALAFGLGLLMVLIGNWVAAHLIDFIHDWVFPATGPGTIGWSLSEGLAAPGQLWASLGLADAAEGPARGLVRPVLLSILAGLLLLALTLAVIADRRRRDTVAAGVLKFAAIGTSWALFVFAAALLTWLAGLPEARPAAPAVLVRGGLVCAVASAPVTAGGPQERVGGSATWAFGDDGRAAFDLTEASGACALDHQMRYPNLTLSEFSLPADPAELAIVVGLASFEGAVATEEQLAARRAATLAREHAERDPRLRVLSIVLGQYAGPAPAGGVKPAESALQRRVLIYLAGRRGQWSRRTPLSPDAEAALLRDLRRDLEATRGLDLGRYSTCVVQSGPDMAPDAALTAAFCGTTPPVAP